MLGRIRTYGLGLTPSITILPLPPARPTRFSSLSARLVAPLSAWALLSAAGLCAQERSFDPQAGLDPDGRIARPELPADLPNPDRWRYTPAGRIVPGSIFDRFLVSSFISPVFSREESVGTGGGFALTDVDFRNQRYKELANFIVRYTSEGQQTYRINWRRWLRHRELENGGIVREDRSIWSSRAQYSRTLTRRFFGFGSRTTENAETSYTEELAELSTGVQISMPNPGDDMLLSGGVRLQHRGLSRGRLDSAPSAEQVFPEEVRAGDGVGQLWLELGAAYDSRDSQQQPHSGFRVGFHTRNAVVQRGGRVGGVFGVEARGAFALPPLFHSGGSGDEESPPTDVFAWTVSVADTHGDLPFYNLPTLGGEDALRGFVANRFTDRAVAYGSLEYRFAVVPRGFRISETVRIERVSLGLFYDFGTMASGLHRLHDGRYLDSYGLGLRLGFSREALFRIDYGISDEDSNLTISFGHAF